LASDGTILSVMLHPSALEGKSQPDRVAALIRSFTDPEEMLVQFDLLSGDVARDARGHRKNCRN
jgi:pyruvate-formate lyase